jgi:hypothetical protein
MGVEAPQVLRGPGAQVREERRREPQEEGLPFPGGIRLGSLLAPSHG